MVLASLAAFACGGAAASGVGDGPGEGAKGQGKDGGTTEPVVVSPGGDHDAGDAGSTVDPGDAGACSITATSSLPHVQIVFQSGTSCVYTLAQAAAKIAIPYDVVVDQDVPDFAPASPYWYGANASVLEVSQVLSGAGQQYCLCDQGLPYPTCPSDDGGTAPVRNDVSCGPSTIRAGTYHQVFTWDGRNWDGPSDTLSPEGPAFPPGDYDLVVSTAPGTLDDAGSVSASATFQVHPVP